MSKRHRPVQLPSRTSYLRSQHLRRTGHTSLPEGAVLSAKVSQPPEAYWRRPEAEKVTAPTLPPVRGCALECVGSTLLRWHCDECGYNGKHDQSPGCQKFAKEERSAFVARIEQAGKLHREKGAFGGRCNRAACLKPGATWWHQSNRVYYCAKCARMLNEDPFNKRDAEALYGGPLCVEHQQEGVLA